MEKYPEINRPVKVILQHWYTKGTRTAELIYVAEDDCNWRTIDDLSELSYDWKVISWEYIEAQPDVAAEPNSGRLNFNR